MKLYVGNLPFQATDDMLRDLFSTHGEVTEINRVMNTFTGQHKGFGFVEMPRQADAEAAMKALNGSSLNGNNLIVRLAKPEVKRSKRRRR